MMLGERHRPTPAIHVPPWQAYEDVGCGVPFSVLPVSGVASGNGGGGEYSPYLGGEPALAALQRFLPSNEVMFGSDDGAEDSDLSDAPPVDAYSCDEFRIYEFKVRRCARGRSHDWTECPYAHPGEKARRRDPRKYHYSGTACPDFRKGSCKRGDACEYAHGVFECWLHPARYRTQPCKDGLNCRRRVCFFAHTPEQLRVLPQQQQQQQQGSSSPGGMDDGSPLRHHSADAYFTKNLISSPNSILISPPLSPPSDSPPLSPDGPSLRRASLPVGSSMNEVLASFRKLQLGKAKSMPASWGLQVAGMGSPRGGMGARPDFCSLPATPTGTSMGGCGGLFEDWGEPTERVESGRDLRAKIYEKLSKEFRMGRDDGDDDGQLKACAAVPDVGWVSDLLM